MKHAIVLLVVRSLIACEREHRELDVPADQTEPAALAPRSSLYPGGAPIAGTDLDRAVPAYRETAQAVSEGKLLYGWFNCVGCHAHGGGGMGPALMDERWIYGSSPSDVATSIIAGRPDGMPSFRGKIAPAQLVELVAYVRSLSGLVRGDTVQARDEHIRLAPASTLQHEGVPWPGRTRP
jgi:cytochrome c oxidase cbb3-type subunit 3